MAGLHHRLNGRELEQTLGGSEGEESLVCRSPWDHRVRHELTIEQHASLKIVSRKLLWAFLYRNRIRLTWHLNPPSRQALEETQARCGFEESICREVFQLWVSASLEACKPDSQAPPPSRDSDSGQKFAFPGSSQGMLMLLVWEVDFKNH